MQAIAAWAEAEAKHAERQTLPFAASHAVEVGAWILPSVTQLCTDDEEDADDQAIGKVAPVTALNNRQSMVCLLIKLANLDEALSAYRGQLIGLIAC